MVTCVACKTAQPGGKFCAECGTALAQPKKYCSGCGVESPPGAKFCSGCGTRVGAPAAQAPSG
jgi:predicted amidophosphoribosyltransferase